ncbi:methylenetetrahydrofolate reductase, partial [Elusimicrobiota bacterium]
MKIIDLFYANKLVFSCEVFPPKDSDTSIIYNTIRALSIIKPDFVSVTYRSESGTEEKTLKIASKIKNTFGMESLMHLTCINSDKQLLYSILEDIIGQNIENILALRGDYPLIRDDVTKKSEFCYAEDLVNFISNRRGGFCIGVAGYPEKHPDSESITEDIKNLKKKINAGADYIITQLFFDTDVFFRYLDLVRAAGINIPVSAGIMPITKAQMIKRVISLSNSRIPEKLDRILNKYDEKPKDMEKAGIEYAESQIEM